MSDITEIFWQASADELGEGYRLIPDDGKYICLICGKTYTEGMIYTIDDKQMDARLAVKTHIREEHGSVFDYLLNMDKRYTGLTETQKEILFCLYQGMDDRDIAKRQGTGSASTIRNHRFKLREKEKQAKILLVLSRLLAEKSQNGKNEDELVSVHKGATMVDDRYVITRAEKEKILSTYLKDGKMQLLPGKEKKKLVILKYVIARFETGRKYTEKEVNSIIRDVVEDYVTVRRYLIEYGFMDRLRDGSEYWVNN